MHSDEKARLVLGTSELLSGRSQLRAQEAVQFLRLAFDYGISSFDTAPQYARGLSELALGRALGGRRVSVTTKWGRTPSTAGRLTARLERVAPRTGTNREDAGAETQEEVHALHLAHSVGFRNKIAGALKSATVKIDFAPSTAERSLKASRRRLSPLLVSSFLAHSPNTDQLDQVLAALKSLRFLEPALSLGLSLPPPVDWEALDARLADFPPSVLLIDCGDSMQGRDVLTSLREGGWEIRLAAPLRVADWRHLPPSDRLRAATALPYADQIVFSTVNLKHLEELLADA